MKTKTELINKAWKVLALVAIALGSFAMYSCGDDDDEKEGIDDKASIVGTWELVKGYHTEDEHGYWVSPEKGEYDIYTFYSDGTYIYKYKYNGGQTGTQSGTYTFNDITGRLLLSTSYFKDDRYDVLTLDASTLVWEWKGVQEDGTRVYIKEYFTYK